MFRTISCLMFLRYLCVLQLKQTIIAQVFYYRFWGVWRWQRRFNCFLFLWFVISFSGCVLVTRYILFWIITSKGLFTCYIGNKKLGIWNWCNSKAWLNMFNCLKFTSYNIYDICCAMVNEISSFGMFKKINNKYSTHLKY